MKGPGLLARRWVECPECQGLGHLPGCYTGSPAPCVECEGDGGRYITVSTQGGLLVIEVKRYEDPPDGQC